MIPGDGIGPELMLHVKTMFSHAYVPVDFEEVSVTSTSASRGEEIHDAIMAVRQNHVALKGSIETDYTLPPSYKSFNNMFCTTLDVYANVIHFKSLPNMESWHKDVDILVVQENSEDEYSNLEHYSVKEVTENLKIMSKAKSLCIAEYAFQLAQKMGAKK
ncbi:Isocitrate dehydrogenase [NAD] subunit gamma 1, mitochondrial [Saguinus oedipus]|uniref:Isocitrate dehydrogenase [NAD] subunit gamma 1, mitochondrial n=1 Tax=Saguinus oedipus TaxID=9490 RepID=A0ABQ9UV28_SAGOE|nr:Isocitrate dehydrogenase [NAD] subunit gamma 1, mitochondrial [Saguinus oedipus]